MVVFGTPFLPDIKLDVEFFRELVEEFGVFIDKRLDWFSRCLCRLDVLDRILIAAAQKQRVITKYFVVTANHVGLNKLKRVANVWFCIHVRNGVGDEEFCHAWIVTENRLKDKTSFNLLIRDAAVSRI